MKRKMAAWIVLTIIAVVAALCLGEVCGLKTAFENLNGTSWEAFSILGFAPVVLGFIALGAAKYFM